jgi:renalase
VTIFEKSRGVGGRMATRRTDEGLQFDHGAQYFTVRDERFEQHVHTWVENGFAAPWEGRICTLTRGNIEWKESTTPRFVGVPGMSAICRHLAEELNIRFRTQVIAPKLADDYWELRDEHGNQLGEFDYVIISAPAPQTTQLLGDAPNLQQQARTITMNGCWAAMLSFDRSLGLPFDGAFVHDSPLSWIARNDSKPQRGGNRESWVLHASPEWTTERIESNPDDVLPAMLNAFWEATGSPSREPNFVTVHRWRYAIPPQTLESRCLFDSQRKIGACGDWCNGPRVEGAFLSGMPMADQVLTNVKSVE